MSIRSVSKAIILHKGKILFNVCQREDGYVYYDLPGGGQNTYESLEDALKREVMEETGYSVRVLRFAALAEEIYTDEALRKRFPTYTHCMLHIFLAELCSEHHDIPTETDHGMQGSVWVSLEDIAALPVTRPPRLQKALPEILSSPAPVFLGTEYLRWICG